MTSAFIQPVIVARPRGKMIRAATKGSTAARCRGVGARRGYPGPSAVEGTALRRRSNPTIAVLAVRAACAAQRRCASASAVAGNAAQIITADGVNVDTTSVGQAT